MTASAAVVSAATPVPTALHSWGVNASGTPTTPAFHSAQTFPVFRFHRDPIRSGCPGGKAPSVEHFVPGHFCLPRKVAIHASCERDTPIDVIDHREDGRK